VHDDSHWPVLRVVIPKQPGDEYAFGDHLHALERFLLRQEPFALVFQLTSNAVLGIEHPERTRRHVLQRRAHAEQYLLGIAFVPHTRLQHTLLKGLLWLAPPPCPTELFADLPSALDWAEERTASRGSDASGLARRSQAPDARFTTTSSPKH
jgi:hypothetical protein